MKKLKFVKSKLKEWNKTVFGDLRERKSAIIFEIERLSTFRTRREFKPRSICFEDSEKEKLGDILIKEEVHGRQSSRIKWIKEGDSNFKFFHRVANGRRKRKFINSLMSEEGENLRSSDDISEEIMNFFGKLYSKSGRNSWRVEGLDWSPIFA